MTDNNTDYKLPQNSYVAFDALTLKDFIVKRLEDDDNFTDQIYEGSNLASIIEIIAYSYHVLLFYLNTTASETTFSQASLYENMNKVVNLVGFKPKGNLTSTCSVIATADPDLPTGSYTLRKYSYFLVDDIQYTVNRDYSFSRIREGVEEPLQALTDNMILYQGVVEEYPVYTAGGYEFETFPIVVDNIVDEVDPKFISEGSISVYVKEANSGKYYEYSETASLFLTDSNERVYDLRLNENGNYEVKFGNGAFGRKLDSADEVYVYYIKSDNVKGVISKNAISNNNLFTWTTSKFEDIYSDVNINRSSDILTSSIATFIKFTNPSNSTAIGQFEDVDSIRENTPQFVDMNLRLVTSRDYSHFIKRNMNSLAESIYVATNDQYINNYLDYFYKISVDPNKVNRIVYNQVNFASSCDFNNINIFCVPLLSEDVDDADPVFLPTSLKNLIVDLVRDYKVISHEIVPRDPIYNTFRIGVTNKQLNKSVTDNCNLVIVRENNNKVSKDSLAKDAADIIRNFFSAKNNELGGLLDVSRLVSDVISLPGVKSIRVENTEEGISFDGLSFIGWNPIYPEDDVIQINQNTKLPFYKFPYLNYPVSLTKYIEVVDE
jgi:hypothetical protein